MGIQPTAETCEGAGVALIRILHADLEGTETSMTWTSPRKYSTVLTQDHGEAR